MQENESDYIILKFDEIILRAADVEVLGGPYWFNDTLISFYFKYLETYTYKDNSLILLVPPAVTQCIKMLHADETATFLEPLNAKLKKFIFFVLNDSLEPDLFSGGTHWSLVVYSKPERKCFHFDSMRGMNSKQAVDLGTKVLDYLKIAPFNEVMDVYTVQQTNRYDSGSHVLAQCDLLIEYALGYQRIRDAPLVNREKIDWKRSDIFNFITTLSVGDSDLLNYDEHELVEIVELDE